MMPILTRKIFHRGLLSSLFLSLMPLLTLSAFGVAPWIYAYIVTFAFNMRNNIRGILASLCKFIFRFAFILYTCCHHAYDCQFCARHITCLLLVFKGIHVTSFTYLNIS